MFVSKKKYENIYRMYEQKALDLADAYEVITDFKEKLEAMSSEVKQGIKQQLLENENISKKSKRVIERCL